ncbi:hypothetical protein LINPERHAP1_LOCUS32937 [Linum perenne]
MLKWCAAISLFLALCARCGSSYESVSRVLRDCPTAAETWASLGFQVEGSDWRSNLDDCTSRGLWGEDGMMFGISVWLIWKARNDAMFAGANPTLSQVARRARWWTDSAIGSFERDANCLGETERVWSSVGWEPGPEDAITVTTDGSFLPDRNLATVGGIL